MEDLSFCLDEIKHGIVSDDLFHARHSFIDASKLCNDLIDFRVLTQFGLLLVDAAITRIGDDPPSLHRQSGIIIKDVVSTLNNMSSDFYNQSENYCTSLLSISIDKGDSILSYREELSSWAALTRFAWRWPPTTDLLRAPRRKRITSSNRYLQSRSPG